MNSFVSRTREINNNLFPCLQKMFDVFSFRCKSVICISWIDVTFSCILTVSRVIHYTFFIRCKCITLFIGMFSIRCKSTMLFIDVFPIRCMSTTLFIDDEYQLSWFKLSNWLDLGHSIKLSRSPFQTIRLNIILR